MGDNIAVPAIKKEPTKIGRVSFPTAVPEGLVEQFDFPDDLIRYAPKLGLTNHHVVFLLAVLRGKWAVTAGVDLPDLAEKTGLSFPQMDGIVRDLVDHNYARLGSRLDLYRFWICLLRVKGVEFVEA